MRPLLLLTAPLLAAAFQAGRAPRADATAHCLAYDDTVSVRGRLVRLTFPGPPDYTSVAQGDERETGFYLELAAPLCARGARLGDDDLQAPVNDVRRVQLLLDSAGYARLRPRLGHPVTVRGTLVSAFTGHHHAPLLLKPVAP